MESIPLSEPQQHHGRERFSPVPLPNGLDFASLQGYNSSTSGFAGRSLSSTDAEPLVGVASSQRTSESKIKTALKTLKLKAFYSLYLRLRGIHPQEERKVALHNHRGYAFLGSMIHFLPVGASLALVSINLREIYVGSELIGTSGQDGQKLAALQFAAKLHELLMISSLTAVVLTYIRRNILYGDGLPFGALFAGQQFRALSFFWSTEFWATIRQRVLRNKVRYKIFIALLVVATLLGVSVGPSTAQLMRPQLDAWPAGGTTFWLNATHETVFPTTLEASEKLDHCLVDTGDVSCPHGGWQIIDRTYCSYFPTLTPAGALPQFLLMDSARSQRFMWPGTRKGYSDKIYPLYGYAYTRATMPMSSIADTAAEIGRLWAIAAKNVQKTKRFWSRKDAKYSIDATQPAVATVCQIQSVSGQTISPYGYVRFPNLTSMWYPDGPHNVMTGRASFMLIDINDDDLVSTVLGRLNSTKEPNILWLDAIEGLGSTLNAVAIFPDTAFTNTSQIFSCSFDTRYFPATTSSLRSQLKISGPDDTHDYLLQGMIKSKYPLITISTGWAQYLNPTINNEGWTAFAQVAKTTGLWNTSTAPDQDFVEVIVEAILTTMTLNGIARTDYNISIAGRAKGSNVSTPEDLPDAFLSELLPRKYLGAGGNAYELTDDELRNAAPFVLRVFATGYAYTYRSTTQIAAVVVLLLYCILAIFHFCYTLKTGEQSNAWDTTPELVALAMNSARTQKLNNTGAGIDTSNVFKEMVRVEVKEGDRLEFVFEDTKETTSDAFYKNNYYA
ncbi:uncharacterized protein BKCO1_5300050 [Diplodia corticola]|uniref:Uncharacterized protein n=1 Tax=Diplodia corticola TaxID=236234 RepID=A0A1J9QR98_9PEZI|nr:uncharacterized protein BKCO1_5300050 [Diplodia corticola]OJD30976.1 hypothetical protein BKCO1_5300050 [Diplodia corticola]